MLKIIPFNLLLIFLVVVVTGTATQAIFNQNVLAQNSGEDSSRGLNFDSLFGNNKDGFSFDELFPFSDSSTSSSEDEESSSSSEDESAATDPLGGIDLVFPLNDIQPPEAQSDTASEDEGSSSPDDNSKSIAPQNESASEDEKATASEDDKHKTSF